MTVTLCFDLFQIIPVKPSHIGSAKIAARFYVFAHVIEGLATLLL